MAKNRLPKTKARAEVFSRETIQNTLNGIDAANKDLADQLRGDPGVAVYRKGFWDALAAVGKAIGTGRKKGKKG